MENINLLTIFLTGLLTGGLTCMAVQGGLLAATLAQREEERLKKNLEKTNNVLPIVSFLLAKLIVYTILGFLLGLLGSAFQLSITTTVMLQFAVAIFMIGTALHILNVHPIFRYFVIQPPRFLTRLVRKQSKSSDIFAPALLGAFTVFIPCGTTQAMMALAIASANPILGAAILGIFVLGTSPIFFTLGFLATKLGDALQQKFMKFASYIIIILALFNVNNAFALTGTSFSLDTLGKKVFCTISYCGADVLAYDTTKPTNTPTIIFNQYGYSPQDITVKAGEKIDLKLINENGGGCIQSFTIPSLNIQKIISVGSTKTIQFTAPSTPTEIAFMCGMGMYRGIIHVL